jgi:hypothetical protein
MLLIFWVAGKHFGPQADRAEELTPIQNGRRYRPLYDPQYKEVVGKSKPNALFIWWDIRGERKIERGCGFAFQMRRDNFHELIDR